MRVSNASRSDGATHCRSQVTNIQRMLDKLCRACADEIYSYPQIVLASENDNREAKLPAPDFFDQRPNAHAGKIRRCNDASTCAGAELSKQLFRVITSAKLQRVGRQSLCDSAALPRQGCNNVDRIAQRVDSDNHVGRFGGNHSVRCLAENQQ